MEIVDSLNNKASFSIIITTKRKLYTGHEEARLNLNLSISEAKAQTTETEEISKEKVSVKVKFFATWYSFQGHTQKSV